MLSTDPLPSTWKSREDLCWAQLLLLPADAGGGKDEWSGGWEGSKIDKKAWGNASFPPIQWVSKRVHQLWLNKCVLDALVVVHCPIGTMIPLLGCVGPAGCQLNFPYVCFLYVKILWTTLGRQRGKERKRREEWDSGSVSLQQNRVVSHGNY